MHIADGGGSTAGHKHFARSFIVSSSCGGYLVLTEIEDRFEWKTCHAYNVNKKGEIVCGPCVGLQWARPQLGEHI